ncbi:MAG: S9 family peptidase [Deltaproteobacteria bacterium]|nr:S9 family peptidase [Nannocystaceae bacterium]
MSALRTVALALACLVACRPHGDARTGQAVPAPPIAPREPTVVELHGVRLEDPYAWLRNRDDPRTRGYLEAENAYTEAMLQPVAKLRAAVLGELRRRIIEDDVSVPVPHGTWEYFDRTRRGEQYAVMLRKPVAGGAEQVVLDLDARARGHEYYAVGDYDLSPDQRMIAFTEDLRGDERYRLHVLDIESGRELDRLDGDVGPSVQLAADSRTVFYTRVDTANREHQLWRRTLGQTEPGTLVIEETDPRFSLSIARSFTDAFMVITASSQITSEVQVVDALHPDRPLRMIEPRRDGIEYDVYHHGEQFLVLTNDGARDFQVMQAPIVTPDRAHWQPLYTPPAGSSLSGLMVLADRLVLTGRANGLPQIWLREHDSGELRAIDWPEPSYDAELGDNRERATSRLRVHYSSPTTPGTEYDYDFATRELVLRKRDPVADFDPADFEVQRLRARADDGAEIPISLVRRRDAPRPAPLVLNGYGAYGSNYDAGFSAGQLPLLDRGVTVAIAHVRGGGELGRDWYEQGKLARKSNTFTDFIRCAEHLIAQGHTTSDRLLVTGGSAGGLLIGAVINMRPELFHAAVADVPFVDVINSMRDASLPLTAAEWEEWGDPRQPDAFAWMRGWSPYDNVRAQDYPHLLVVAGWHDSRVGFWEPAKWTARLRASKTDDHQLLLHTEMGSGHGGASGRYDALDEQAMVLAFMLDRLGVKR